MSPLLECLMLFETPLCVIAQKDHPVAANKRISLRRLNDYPFVFFPYGIHTRMEIEQMFIKKNLPVLVPRIEVNVKPYLHFTGELAIGILQGKNNDNTRAGIYGRMDF